MFPYYEYKLKQVIIIVGANFMVDLHIKIC